MNKLKRLLTGDEDEDLFEVPIEVTEDEITESLKEYEKQKKQRPWVKRGIQFFTIVWMLGHLGILYVGLGSSISGGVLLYVLIQFFILSHYLILLRHKQ